MNNNDLLRRIAGALGNPSPLGKNPRQFVVHPDAYYGPYPVSYLARFFKETREAWEIIEEEARRLRNLRQDPQEDPYAEIREQLKKLPGFLRPPGGEQGLVVQGWILLRFPEILPPLTPGKGWTISPREALEIEKRASEPKRPRATEPCEKYKARIEKEKAEIRAKKQSPRNDRGITG